MLRPRNSQAHYQGVSQRHHPRDDEDPLRGASRSQQLVIDRLLDHPSQWHNQDYRLGDAPADFQKPDYHFSEWDYRFPGLEFQSQLRGR